MTRRPSRIPDPPQAPRWAREFGPAYAVPEAVTATLYDVSWHNDVCPSFILDAATECDDPAPWRLWVEHPDPNERETGPETARYIVHNGEEGCAYEGDDLEAALVALRTTPPPTDDEDKEPGASVPPSLHLIDVLTRTIAVFETQLDENGEPIREGNQELYRELVALVAKLEGAR